ncbi:hypothetical protein C8T65DRAFT_588529 [Cerioporus squamosus]|nr:hypothetical protein C8T65DRAFT_588529 [Cerioporus squamosus]
MLSNGSTKTDAVDTLQDWPTDGDFRHRFLSLYQGFLTTIPIECRDLVRSDGVLNLSAHYPTQALMPDLGPKLYSAMGSEDDSYGTTKLHLDVTDAINILTWSPTLHIPSAIWHIFPAEYAGTLRNFLVDETKPEDGIHPVYKQTLYLTDDMLARLKKKHGISPWTIYQRVGDAILIPAGCAHQVRNSASAIKVACDFVSPQNIDRTLELTSEFRLHRLSSQAGEDILQAYTMLWYAWLSVTSYKDQDAGQSALFI